MDSLYVDYDNLLIGRSDSIGAYNFYGQDAHDANHLRALSCIKYAIEKVLEYDIHEAVLYFDEYMVHRMKLDKIIEYIKWPPDVPVGNTRYILSLLYPRYVNVDREDIVIEKYQNVLQGDESFPRGYFMGSSGIKRFNTCLQYAIDRLHPMSSLDEIYRFFSSSEGNEFLSRNRLKIPSDHFGIDIFSSIHQITEDLEYAELYYSFYVFKRAYDALIAPRLAHSDTNGSKAQKQNPL